MTHWNRLDVNVGRDGFSNTSTSITETCDPRPSIAPSKPLRSSKC